MDRRQLLKQTALAVAGFTFSRDLFSREADRIIAAHDPGEFIRLSSNENPHGPSPMARKAMMDLVNRSNRYPGEAIAQLRQKLALRYNLSSDNIAIGAGSSELLGVVSVMAALQKGNCVAPDPTFRLWMTAAKSAGLPTKLVPLTSSRITDLQRMKESIDANTRMVYLCNPANPTSNIVAANDLRTFIKEIAPRCILLLDEAYTEFCDEPSMASMVNDYPNLVVAKTFSKIHGMAGARVGYAIAHQKTIIKINELQPWANAGASAVSIAGALASLDDSEFSAYCKKENQKARAILYSALEKSGMPYLQSHTNFVYFDARSYPNDVRQQLESHQIVGARTFEDGTKWLRLSVGTSAEMEKVAEALKA
jgi:histidinol-phosphate aminotransferase